MPGIGWSSAGAAWLSMVAMSAAVAGPWDGQYTPEGFAENLFCNPEAFGPEVPFGTWSIRNDRLSVEEGSCLLTNPVNVRDMPGILYDAECNVEGDRWIERVLVIRSPYGIDWVAPGYTRQLNACP